MAIAFSDLLTGNVATASAGLAGGPNLNRSAKDGASAGVHIADFTVPASGPGSANGDVIYLCQLNVMSRISRIVLIFSAWGTSVTLSIGKVDPNNAANTDAVHYLAATSVAAAGNNTPLGANLGEQVGADPSGAVTDTGNAVPGFGELPIIITATIGGAAPTAAATLRAIIEESPGGR